MKVMTLTFKENSNKSNQLYKLLAFILLNYLIAFPFFFLMVRTLNWNHFYGLYVFSLVVFLPLLLLFMLIFPKTIGKLKKLAFSFVWVLASAILIETLLIFISHTQTYNNTMIVLAGDWTLLMPVWIVLTLLEFIAGVFLLNKQRVLLIKYNFITKVFFNLWGICAVVLTVGTSHFFIKAFVPLVVCSLILTWGLNLIRNCQLSKIATLLSFLLIISLLINTLVAITIWTASQLDYGTFFIELISALPYSTLTLSPIIILMLITNDKLNIQ